MRNFDFETKLMVGIAMHRLSLLRDSGNRNLFYSSIMYEPEEEGKVYLLEVCEGYFIVRSDFTFDDATQRFIYVSKDKFEDNENNLREAFVILRNVERKVYDIMSKLELRGFYTKGNFMLRLLQLMPQLELSDNIIKDRKSGKALITIKEDSLHFAYEDGKAETNMNIAKKDFNEKVLQQCVALITSALKCENG